MNEALFIASIFLFPNGMIAVCDQYGQQMPDYQGKYAEVIDKLRKADTDKATLHGISRLEVEK